MTTNIRIDLTRFSISLIIISIVMMSQMFTNAIVDYTNTKQIINYKSTVSKIGTILFAIGLILVFIYYSDQSEGRFNVSNSTNQILLLAVIMIFISRYIKLWVSEDLMMGSVQVKTLDEPLRICGWIAGGYSLMAIGNFSPVVVILVSVSTFLIIISNKILEWQRKNCVTDFMGMYVLGVASVLLSIMNSLKIK